jgi:hypothetical protein
MGRVDSHPPVRWPHLAASERPPRGVSGSLFSLPADIGVMDAQSLGVNQRSDFFFVTTVLARAQDVVRA